MSKKRGNFSTLFSSLLLLTMLLALSSSALAQDGGLRIDYSDETGRVSFIGADPARAYQLQGVQMESIAAADRPMLYLQHFGALLGLQSPGQELQQQFSRAHDGRSTTRYQQVYQGVPIMGGELIVNLDARGSLLSISGEISPDLDLATTPEIDADTARETAIAAVARGYGLEASELAATEPELWIYDQRLLRPSTRPAELVWRMDVASADGLGPIRELVLINAARGGISLHFNQIDTSWGEARTTPAPQAVGEDLFTSYILYLGADSADALGIGDFNDDGRNDVAMTVGVGIPADTYLYVYLQDSGGNLQSPASYPLGGRPESLDVGDLNDDGLDDVVVGLFSADQIGVLLQNASGTLDAMVTYTCDNGPDSVKVGDLNDDGLMDVVVSHWSAANIGVFLQQGDGSLGAMVSYASNAAGYDEIDVGDVNDDGLTDVVKMNGQGYVNPNIMVYLQSETGTLEAAVPYNLDDHVNASGLAIGDVTGDGLQDVVISYGGNRPNSNVAVFAQNALGTLDAPVSYSAYDIPEPVEIADVNEDGRLDVVTAHGGWSTVSVYLQSAAGTLEPYIKFGVPYTSHYRPEGLAVDDINSDGLPDIALASSNSGLIVLEHYNYVPPPPGGTRLTYDSENTEYLRYTLLCDEGDAPCTGTDDHADAAHDYAAYAYDFYDSHHGRDSIDGAGMTIVSNVHFDLDYPNAYWDGDEMVYGDAYGFPLADDVVGHELTHGVTQHTSNLFYYYQSGAINESFSDVWGEFIDLTDGLGTDNPSVRWLMGEDVAGLGAIRDMADPTNFLDPDRMTSSFYQEGSSDYGNPYTDSGYVHANSGVNNKAAYLMTDGGGFNGQTITGLGIDKVAAIYYEVQTSLLTSGADYKDLYNALYQGCTTLVGTLGITAGDCTEVQQATIAVEMDQEPVTGYNPEAGICDGPGEVPTYLFSDDFESGMGNWTTGYYIGGNSWFFNPQYSTSGTTDLWGADRLFLPSDTYAAMAADVALPSGSQPFLRFNHAFGFEDPDYDGGWLEYSTNSGGSWSDAGPMFDDGLDYSGSIVAGFGNPNGGHVGFVGDSHGYVSTRYDLSDLAGGNVRFRYRMSVDSIVFDLGWFIDDVDIYTCVMPNNEPNTPSNPDPADTAADVSVYANLSWDGGDPDGDPVTYDVYFDASDPTPEELTCDDVSDTTCNPGVLAPSTTYYWYVEATDGEDTSAGPVWSFTTSAEPADPLPVDFDGDYKTDPAKFDASTGTLSYLESSTSTWQDVDMGTGTYDYVSRSDFDGDGKTDPAKFVPSAGSLWYLESTSDTWQGVYMGPGSYQLVTGSDFDGDGQTDPALFITDGGANALWYLESSTTTWQGIYMGPGSYDLVEGSDFDGDGATDPALFYSEGDANALWYLESGISTWQGAYMGPGTYEMVPASDFDGDGESDPALFDSTSASLWYLQSNTGTWAGQYMGTGTYDYVAASDFDGDGATDPAEFVPGTDMLWWIRSSDSVWDGVWMESGSYEIVN